jgi:hypothetical protein
MKITILTCVEKEGAIEYDAVVHQLARALRHGRTRREFYLGVHAQWKQALEGWNMRVSQQVLEWQTEAKVEHQQANVLRLFEKPCKTPVPNDLVEAIHATQDMTILSRWFDAAAEVNTQDEFRAATQLPS